MPLSQTISFRGKKVLVTGGGHGLGRQTVKRFYEDGAIVYTVEIDERRVDDLRKDFPKITAVQLDVSDLEKAKAVVESFGPLDLLVNNAGIYIAEPFVDASFKTLNRVVDINFKGMYVVSQAVAKGMIEGNKSGTIINLSSMVSKRASVPLVSIYSCTKIAIAHMTRSMAVELSPHNIRVNAIAPGVIDSPAFAYAGESLKVAIDAGVNMQLFKRMIDPNEVIDFMFYLMSPLAAMITGQELSIDGGSSIL